MRLITKINTTVRGQSLIEYSIVLIVVCVALLAMSSYIKRSMQGRWKATTDEFGDQYDPRVVNSLINYSINSSSNTVVSIDQTGSAQWTTRTDTTNSVETKNGQTLVGAAPLP